MRRNSFRRFDASALTILALVFLTTACSVNVKKEPNGQDKQVDIDTIAGGIHVSKQADVSDVGLPVYPGAKLKEEDSDGSDKSANVNISGFGFGIKVIAVEYKSDDAPTKILAFYRDQLKKYGNVIECHTSSFNVNMSTKPHGSNNNSDELTCEGNSGKDVELKVGKKNDQHIVAVESEGKGSSFSLVYVRAHGKQADI